MDTSITLVLSKQFVSAALVRLTFYEILFARNKCPWSVSGVCIKRVKFRENVSLTFSLNLTRKLLAPGTKTIVCSK